jgi:hypothetical protein
VRCYFMRDGHIAGIEMLPRTVGPRRSREGPQAVFKAQGRIDGFEVWDGARLVIRHPLTRTKPPSGRNHRVNR